MIRPDQFKPAFAVACAAVMAPHAFAEVEPDAALIEPAFRVLQSRCLKCHTDEKRKGGLTMTSREGLLDGGDTDVAIVPGNAPASLMIEALFPDADPHMPPKSQLEPAEIQLLERWVDAGAPWDAARWETLRTARQRVDVELAGLPGGFLPSLALAVSPDGARLAVGRGSWIEVFSLGDNPGDDGSRRPVAVLAGHDDAVQSLAWAPDGTRLASGGFRKVILWNVEHRTAERAISDGLAGRITALAFSADGAEVIAADSIPSATSRLHWLNAADGGIERTIDPAHDDSILDLELSPDGGRVATAGADKVVQVRGAESGELHAVLEGDTGFVLAVAFSPESDRLATAGDDASIKVWSTETWKRLSTFGGGRDATGPVTGLAWLRDEENARKKAEESDPEKAAAISTDLIFAVNERGEPRLYTELVDHEGGERSAGAKERRYADVDGALMSVAAIPGSRSVIAAGAEGDVFAWRDDGVASTLRSRSQFDMQRGGGDAVAESRARSERPMPSGPPAPASATVSFRNDILPILSKAGCAAGACHAKAGGQNGFQLSIFAYDPRSDYHEMVRDARGRRLFASAPEHSLILLKATNTIPHEGEERFPADSEFYRTIRQWIAQGAQFSVPDEPDLDSIDAMPADATFAKGESRSLQVTARYSDGSTRDVTSLAEFTSVEPSFAEVDEHGTVTAGNVAGDGVVVVRFLDEVAAARVTIPPDQLQPEEAYAELPAVNEIDRLAQARFRKLGLLPSAPCSDAEFIRRATLDAIGKLPDGERVRAFLADTDPDKRSRLIDELLGPRHAGAYADYWATKWGDLLRPNTQRVGVKPVYLLDQWIRDRFRANQPCDEFAREILTASGSSHDFGPVAIVRDKREPADLGEFISRIFLGTRIECARCHHHPSEQWGQDDYYSFAAFFASLKRKGQGISAPISGLPEFWWFEPGGDISHPVTGETMPLQALDGTRFANLDPHTDPRAALADWMTSPDNPLFAKAIANRIWGELFGRGIVHPVDDLRATNPAVNEPLLDWLADELVRLEYDAKALLRTIMRSQLYQQSSLPNETNIADTRNFSRSYRRRLPAEVLADAIVDLTGKPDRYDGLVPGAAAAMRQWNHKVPSDFLDAFGRPDSSAAPPCEREPTSSTVQALHLMNSDAIQQKLSADDGWLAGLRKSDSPPAHQIEEIYLAAFARFPDDEERALADAYFRDHSDTASQDLLWSLINSAEFVYNH